MIDDVDTPTEPELLASARRGDSAAFERLVAGYRGELYAHCYRMLGSVEDAEDALQESLLGAWRGMAGFEGRSSLRLAVPRQHQRLPAADRPASRADALGGPWPATAGHPRSR